MTLKKLFGVDQEIEEISEIDFLDIKVKVYYDPKSTTKDNVHCLWKRRNEDSYYQGIMYINHENGEITYPDGVVIPEQTERDRENIPKTLFIGVDKINDNLLTQLKLYLTENHKLRNPKLYE